MNKVKTDYPVNGPQPLSGVQIATFTGFAQALRAQAHGQKNNRQPWGALRQRNLLASIRFVFFMILIGVVSFAALAVLFVFAASVAVISLIGFTLLTLTTLWRRQKARVRIKAEADGVIKARKVGNSWVAY
jgi:fatty acid desaturase